MIKIKACSEIFKASVNLNVKIVHKNSRNQGDQFRHVLPEKTSKHSRFEVFIFLSFLSLTPI